MEEGVEGSKTHFSLPRPRLLGNASCSVIHSVGVTHYNLEQRSDRSGLTSIPLLLVSPMSSWSQGEPINKLRRLENHPYLPHHPVVHSAGPQVHAGGMHL